DEGATSSFPPRPGIFQRLSQIEAGAGEKNRKKLGVAKGWSGGGRSSRKGDGLMGGCARRAGGFETPPPGPLPEAERGSKRNLLPLCASGRGPGGGVRGQCLSRSSPRWWPRPARTGRG